MGKKNLNKSETDIRFESVKEAVVFRSPLAGMQPVTGQIERRRDPLTGRVAIVSSFFEEKRAVVFPKTDQALIAELAQRSRAGCFFCPEKVETAAPRYLDAWVPDGRVRKGQCLLFPNLYPLSAVHAVITLGEQHYRELNDFGAPLIADGLSCAREFVSAVIRNDPALCYFTLNSNYLFPAGASVVHPHFQLLGSSDPSSAVARLKSACQKFKARHHVDYFSRLIDTETRLGERVISCTGPIIWLAPFAPYGANEILGILPGTTDWASLDQTQIDALASGLSKVLIYYHQKGFSTFNFSLYSDTAGKSAAAFPMFLRIVCRQNVYANPRSDDYFLQKLLEEDLVVTLPEHLAAEVRTLFR